MPVPIAESSNIEWIDNNGVKFPFRRENVGYDGHGPVNPVQFETTGAVTAAFLNAGALAHTLKFTITADDIDAVKDLVRTSPEYDGGNGFHWPFTDDVATANNKDDLTIAFENVYDGTSKAAEDIDEDDSIPTHHIRPGVKVRVEYTLTTWSAKKSKDGAPAKFGSGCSLKLQAIVLLQEIFYFGSPRKRRRVQ